MRNKRTLALLLSAIMIIMLLPMGAAVAHEQDGTMPSADGELIEEATGSEEGIPLSVFSGREGEWSEVAHSTYSSNDLTLRGTSDGTILYTIVEGDFRNTRNVYYISIAGRDGGFNRLGRPNVHYIVANGYLWRPTADQATSDTPEFFGTGAGNPNFVTGANANALRVGRISMDYNRPWTGMRLRLDQIGNPNPEDIRISWQGFTPVVRSTTPAHLPADTSAFMAITTTFDRLTEEGVYYPRENFEIILNPLVGGGASLLAGGAFDGQVMGYAYVSWRSLEPVRGRVDLAQARIYAWGDYPTLGPNRDQWGSRGGLLTPLLQTYANNGHYVQLRMIMDLPEGDRGIDFPADQRIQEPGGGFVAQADQRRFVNMRNRRVADIPDWAVAAMRHESNRPNPACPDNIPNRADFNPGILDPGHPDFREGDNLYIRMRDPEDPNFVFFQAFRDLPFVEYANDSVTVPDGYFRCAIPNPNGGPDLRVCPNGCEPYRRPAGVRARDAVAEDFPSGAYRNTFNRQQVFGWDPDDNWGPEGVWYFSLPAISGGVGLAPRYDHHMLLHYHENIMNLLAEEIARPGSPWNAVAQVQLGSLGFWGEWHNWPTLSAGTFPNAEVAYPFVRHYIDAFACNDNVQIGMRYANWIATKYDLGLFHDEAGQGSHFLQANKAAQQNLSVDNFAPDGWGRGHGQDPRIAENRNANMANVPEFTGIPNDAAYADAASNPTAWMLGGWSGGEYGDTSAPGRAVGSWDSGPFQGNAPMNAMADFGAAATPGGSNNINNYVMNTIYAFRWNNVSNLAPRGPAAGRLNPQASGSGVTALTAAQQQTAHKNNDAAYDNMGYRFVVEEIYVEGVLEPGETVDVNMVVNNKGVAPFHRDWPFEVSFISEAGVVVDTVIIDSVDIREWLPRHRAINNARPPMTNYRYAPSGARVYYRTPEELSSQGNIFIPAFDGRNDVEFSLAIPADLPGGNHTLAISILDPILGDNNPGIRFHNLPTRTDGRFLLEPFVVEGEEDPDARPWSGTVSGIGTLTQIAGSATPGSIVTLALEARPGYRLTAIDVAGDGIDQGSVTRNLSARTISFVMPEGAETLAITVTPTWAVAFDPGAYSMRLQGDGTGTSATGFALNQMAMSELMPGDTLVLSMWVKGTADNLDVRFSGAGNPVLLNRAVDYDDWTLITTQTPVPGTGGWATLTVQGINEAPDELLIASIHIEGWGVQNGNFADGFNSWHDFTWAGNPLAPGSGWSIVQNVVTVPTYTVTRSAASTVPAANMAITPAGEQPAGTTMTVTITPPTGQQIVENSLSITGVPNITLTANGATFPMPAGGGTITVNAQFAYPSEPFDPGDYSLRLMGDGTISSERFTPHQSVNFPVGTFEFSVWVKGDVQNLSIRAEGGMGNLYFVTRSAVSYGQWTQITSTVVCDAPGWRTFIITAGDSDNNHVYLTNFSLINPAGNNVLQNPELATGNFNGWHLTADWAVNWLGVPGNPGNNWAVVANEVGAPTYTVTRAAASTVPAANMTITPAGPQEVGTTMTVTVTPPEGQQIVADSLSVTGVPNITLTATGATFPMPAGGGEITVNAQFEDIPQFDPGDYSLRLQGDGNSVFRPHQSVRRSTVAGEEITISFWAKGTGNLRMHIYGPPNVDLFNGPVDFENWTLVTNTVTLPSAGWVTFVIQGFTTGDNAVYIDDISFTSTAPGVFLGALDNLDFERHGLNGFGNGTFGSGHWFRPDFGWIGSPPETTYRGGAWTIVSHYAIPTYTVTRAAASTVPVANMTITPEGYQEVGTPMTVTITPPAGHIMVPNSITVTGVPNITITENGATFPMPAGGGEITVNAEFERTEITVTFDPTGGIVNPTSRVVTIGQCFGGAFPMPRREGYRFLGWFTAPTGGSRIVGTSTVRETSDITLFARWEQGDIITVTFNANSGTTTEASRQVRTGETFGGAFRMPTRQGYVFLGWFTAPTGGTRIVGTQVVNHTTNFTLYAQWRNAEMIRVTFNANSGTTTEAYRDVLPGSTFGGAFRMPTRPGHIFEGWFTAVDGGTRVVGTQTVTQTTNITLFARWRPAAVETLTVTFNAMGGTTTELTRVVTVGETFGGSFQMPRREDYVFLGWFTTPTIGGTRILGTHRVTQNADFTLFARWSPAN